MPRLLYLRWAQWNALTPFFLIGGHDEHRPWKFDPEFLRIFRRYMWLHSELVPFFYSQHVQASLRETLLQNRELLKALKHHRRQAKLVRSTLSSLKELQGMGA